MSARILFGDICVHFDLNTLHGLWRTCRAGIQMRRDFTGTYAGDRFIVTFRNRVVFYVDPAAKTILLDGRAIVKVAQVSLLGFVIIFNSTVIAIHPRDVNKLLRVCKMFKYSAAFYSCIRSVGLPADATMISHPRKQTKKYIYWYGAKYFFESDYLADDFPYQDDGMACNLWMYHLCKIENAAV